MYLGMDISPILHSTASLVTNAKLNGAKGRTVTSVKTLGLPAQTKVFGDHLHPGLLNYLEQCNIPSNKQKLLEGVKAAITYVVPFFQLSDIIGLVCLSAPTAFLLLLSQEEFAPWLSSGEIA